jgi:hypothetical protein
MFALSRGNYETIVFIFVALFVYFYQNGKASLSVIFLSLAIAMKPFPAVFLILLFSNKKYKEAAYTILLAVLITIASYASFNGGIIINLKSHLATLQMYNNEYAIGNDGLGYGNSMFGATKIFIAYFYPESFHIVVNKLFRIYTLLTAILFGLISIYIIIVEKEYWKKVALLVFCMNIFPHVSADYKLIHLFIPLFLYINTKKTDNNDLLYISIFSLLVISKSYYYFRFDPSAAIIPYATNSAAILNPVIMITGVIIIMTSGIKKLWYNNLNVKTESM